MCIRDRGKIAFFPTVRLLMGIYSSDPNMTFDWGSFYLPAMQDGETARRLGNSGAGQGSQYLFIPKTTVDNGKLELARDLLYYVTSPSSMEYWCSKQSIPCFTPGTPLEEVIHDDPQKLERYRGFLEPPTVNNMVSGLNANQVFGPAIVVQDCLLYTSPSSCARSQTSGANPSHSSSTAHRSSPKARTGSQQIPSRRGSMAKTGRALRWSN